MNIEDLISKSLDEPLSEAEAKELQEALASSSELRELARDLRAIKALASTPVRDARENPSPELLARLPKAQKPQRFSRVVSGMLVAAAAALLFFMPWGSGALSDEFDPEVIAQLEYEASLHFDRQIAGLEKMATLQLTEMSPREAQFFVGHLSRINKAIGHYRQQYSNEMGRSERIAATDALYREKVELLSAILEV